MPESSATGASSEVLKLECPFCHGVLNLRRIHLGIEGACVHCAKPVTAIEDETGCRLVGSMEIPETPLFSSTSDTDQTDFHEASQVNPQASFQQDSPEPPSEIVPPITPAQPVDSSKSIWGFPEKKEDDSPLHQVNPIGQSQPEMEPDISFAVPDECLEPTEVIEDAPFQSQAVEMPEAPEKLFAEETESVSAPPPLPEVHASVPETAPFQRDEPVVDVPSQLVEEPVTSPFQSSETPPPLEAIPETAAHMPPPLEPVAEVSEAASPPPFAEESPFATSEVPETSAPPASQPLPGGISPFSTGSAKRIDAGFAEALFTNAAAPEIDPGGPPTPMAPEMSPPDDAAFNAANQWGPPANAMTSDGVELDFSAAAAPVKRDEEPATSEVPTPARLPKKRKSGFSFIKKVFKFFLVVGVIGGMAFAANTFVPEEKWVAWKQQAIDWLEPGAVILDKLPFGKDRNVGPPVRTPVKTAEPPTRTRQEISEELLKYPQRQPGG